ncbi:MAG: hypothetical protein HN521_18695 [Candidatus Latescibacteria bacterium]|jgi:hypothetical protein|nr:hypothetical protein [Candidatus Latescibacterota bacterium]
MENHNRNWLVGYVTQKIPNTPRKERYLGLFEATLDDTYLGLDLNWLSFGEESGYFARSQTNIIGRLAFAWHTAELSFYQDPTVGDMLRQAFMAVADHITPEGQFIWPNDKDMYWAGSHEHAWRLEPLLMGFIWADGVFSDDERDHVAAALRRAADWLIANPCIQHNNRGIVWCAIVMLCGLYYDDSAMQDVAASEIEAILRGVILEDGEIGEHTKQYAGGGPCTNYTYTGLGYVYLYRLFSGDDGLDTLLMQGARWLSIYNSISGYPLAAGASVRVAKPDPALTDGLPFLEWASHTDPFFARVADRHLNKMASIQRGVGTHIISPTIWAMLARGVDLDEIPEWYQNWTEMYERPNVQYALIGREYQTGITFRARLGPYRDVPEEGVHLRGLQTFAYGEEVPILFHGRNIVSTTCADQTDTCMTNAIKTAVFTKNGLDIIAEYRNDLETFYIFSPISTLVVHLCGHEKMRSFWSLFESNQDNIALDPNGRVVAFSDREGRVCFLQGNAELYAHEEGDDSRWMLDVISESSMNAFAFSNGSFHFGDCSLGTLTFSDASGSYDIDLSGIRF